MTRVYFVCHAQPEHNWKEDRTRPLTEEGKKDSAIVLDFEGDKLVGKHEHCYVEKEFKGNQHADKK